MTSDEMFMLDDEYPLTGRHWRACTEFPRTNNGKKRPHRMLTAAPAAACKRLNSLWSTIVPCRPSPKPMSN